MLGELWYKDSVLKRCLLYTLVALMIVFVGVSEVSAAQIAPVSALPLQGDSANFDWQATQAVKVATTKEELMEQYAYQISQVPEDQATFTISLAATKDVYDWAVDKAVNYNALPVNGNPVVQDSYHIFRIQPKPYYARDNVRRFDLLISVGKDINDPNLVAESIKTTKEMAVVAQAVARNIETLDDRGKLNYIDDWVAYHFNYDYSFKKFTAAEGYKTGQFVCSGYTEMYKLIADYAGLGNKVEVIAGEINVQGAQGYHSWIIYTGDNGVRYLIDPTHNDYYGTRKSCKKWFMIEEGRAQGYTATDTIKPVQSIFEQ